MARSGERTELGKRRSGEIVCPSCCAPGPARPSCLSLFVGEGPERQALVCLFWFWSKRGTWCGFRNSSYGVRKFCVHGDIVFKVGQELAIADMVNAGCALRPKWRPSFVHYGVGGSKGNGFAEELVQSLEGMPRVHRLAVKAKIWRCYQRRCPREPLSRLLLPRPLCGRLTDHDITLGTMLVARVPTYGTKDIGRGGSWKKHRSDILSIGLKANSVMRALY